MKVTERELLDLRGWLGSPVPFNLDTWAVLFTLTLSRKVNREEADDAITRLNKRYGEPSDYVTRWKDVERDNG